jgi:hypothetical protein
MFLKYKYAYLKIRLNLNGLSAESETKLPPQQGIRHISTKHILNPTDPNPSYWILNRIH